MLERFSDGLRDASHIQDVVDLHGIGFDPVFRERDDPNWINNSVPDDVLEYMDVRQSLIRSARSKFRKFLIDRWIGTRTPREIIRERKPLLKHKKALIINRTIFDQRSYEDGLATAMQKVVDEYCLHYPGIETVQHEYLHAVHGADVATRQKYLDRAYQLGRGF